MITQTRKGKDKYVVEFDTVQVGPESGPIRAWCEELFGPGGRNHKYRWRYGWTDVANKYYFKHEQDAMLFVMRWA